MADIEQVIAAMIEEPWNADDLLEPLSKKDRLAVRGALLARVKRKLEREALDVLGQFPDAEVIALMGKVLANKKAGSGPHVGAVSALEAMDVPAAKKLLRDHLEHPEINVARTAIESLDDKPAAVLKLLLPLVDRIAKRGDDLLMLSLVEKLVEVAPKDPKVIAALAPHWSFSVVHEETLMASNAIFDALIEHAPHSPVAQAAFQDALASKTEYGIVRGRAALALTGRDTATHVKALKKMKGMDASSNSFRKDALDQIAKKMPKQVTA